MAVIRLPEPVRATVHAHLFTKPGEHFAFLHARTSSSTGTPVFLVHDVTLVPDDKVTVDKHGWQIDPDYLLDIVNNAVRSDDALIEAHNHGGSRPRPSSIDRDALAEFVPYILDSLPGRPYAATIWTQATIYGEYHQPNGSTGLISSITSVGDRLRQLVSRDDDGDAAPAFASRQLPWFTAAGQQQLGRLRVAVVGAGGTGSHVILQLPYLGVRDLLIIDRDELDETSLNRVVTGTPADIGTNKSILGRRIAKSVAPDCHVDTLPVDLRDPRALDALKGADVIFGCVDNDGARLILNELAVAYAIPYLDLGVGIDAPDGTPTEVGGRLAAILPGGPCLTCMHELDLTEARYHLATPAEQQHARDNGYITGIDIPAPSVVSLNGTIASISVNELALYLTGARPIQPYTELDLLGTGRKPAQWLTPRAVARDPGCLTCTLAWQGDPIAIDRYALALPDNVAALPFRGTAAVG
jgi:molybdopterin/thiamine biosynthesis adenylyltransferase